MRPETPGRRLAMYAFMTLLALLFVVPMVFMVAGAFKPNVLVLAEGNTWRAFWPTDASFDNFVGAFRRGNFGLLFINSMIISTSVVVLGLVVNSLMGYALARLPFPGSWLLLLTVIALTIIPLEAVAIPLLWMMSEVGLRNTYIVQILPFIANPLFVYLFYTFFLGIPRELEEAARVDGAGPLTTFVRVTAPLAKPAYATVGILSFLFIWGQLLWPVLVTSGPDVRPLPLGMSVFVTQPPIELGPDHGVRVHDDHPAPRAVHRVPALVRPVRGQQWGEGLTAHDARPVLDRSTGATHARAPPTRAPLPRARLDERPHGSRSVARPNPPVPPVQPGRPLLGPAALGSLRHRRSRDVGAPTHRARAEPSRVPTRTGASPAASWSTVRKPSWPTRGSWARTRRASSRPPVSLAAPTRCSTTGSRMTPTPSRSAPKGADLGFRDPFVWREDGRWWQAVGAGSSTSGGSVRLYSSTDLRAGRRRSRCSSRPTWTN
jgi:multiple sugar transport system permease protein